MRARATRSPCRREHFAGEGGAQVRGAAQHDGSAQQKRVVGKAARGGLNWIQEACAVGSGDGGEWWCVAKVRDGCGRVSLGGAASAAASAAGVAVQSAVINKARSVPYTHN